MLIIKNLSQAHVVSKFLPLLQVCQNMYQGNMPMAEQIQVDSSAQLYTLYNFESEHFHWHQSKFQ